MERFTPLKSGADPKFIAVWSKMDLGHVFGFPAWEKEVFMLLMAAHPELSNIFIHYAKSGTAGSVSATAVLTMQQTELVDLAQAKVPHVRVLRRAGPHLLHHAVATLVALDRRGSDDRHACNFC